ncbi:MAG: SpoIIE family protein phosphatase [Caldilineaceae bacterium]|nr:SpoIIE family protein phosphatase [Caldilineaceae bacterium]
MSKRILVVEDDPSLREWVQFELEGDGYHISTAADGVKAVAALEKRELPDLVLLDVQLPGINGYDVCRRLKNDERTAAIPVIFLTSRSTLEDKMQGFDAGGTDYLPKPFTMAELKARIKAMLRQTQLGRQQGEAAVAEEMAQAAAIQQNLMPQVMPQVAGARLAARSTAAKHVGGDFYDLFLRRDDSLCVVEADVSGKGLPAALIMTAARTAIRGAVRYTPTVQESMKIIGRHLYDDLTDVGKFITTFLAVFDPAQRTLSYTNAGHSLVVLCTAEHGPQVVEPDGPPLGVLPKYDYAGHQVDFGPDDLLVLASDGFYEAVNQQGEMYGQDRLLARIGALRTRDVGEILDALFQDVDAFAGGADQFDDQTCVIVKGSAA